MNNWLNRKRLRDYPRLILISSWTVLILNFILHRDWIGGLSGILLGGDFISNYASGWIYRTDIHHLYDPNIQEQVQLSLISTNIPTGFAPFISPPYVALAYSVITFIPLPWALTLWIVSIFICAGSAIYLMQRHLVPIWLVEEGLTPFQLTVVILSSFAFIIGTQAGQSHAITLLLVTGIVIFTLNGKWLHAGVLAGCLLYKPHFIVGFLILWLVWRRWRALIGFGLITLCWAGAVLITRGVEPYLNYIEFSNMLMLLPYSKDSFPISIMVTPYALVATLFPATAVRVIQTLLLILTAVLSVGLGFFAHQMRNVRLTSRCPALVLALLYPLLTMPHTLVYDLIILVPAFLLLVHDRDRANQLKYPVVGTYLGALILPLIGYAVKLALTALIPILIFITQIRTLWAEGINNRQSKGD